MRVVQDQEDEGGNKPQEKPQKKDERVERPPKSQKTNRLCGLVEGWVLDTLGRSPNFSHVRAYHLWDNRFRVNIWTNENRISDSFFIHAVLDGITHSSPALEKKYADPAATTPAGPELVEAASSNVE